MKCSPILDVDSVDRWPAGKVQSSMTVTSRKVQLSLLKLTVCTSQLVEVDGLHGGLHFSLLTPCCTFHQTYPVSSSILMFYLLWHAAYNSKQTHAKTGKKVYITLFLAFVGLLIYCVNTWFLNSIWTSLSFITFLFHTDHLHPPTKIPVQNDY